MLTDLLLTCFYKVGESGCGKSTIAKLVQRFYDPTDGRILLDGTDTKDISVRDLRSCIGVVSQEPLLFDTTIEDNIRYGKPDATFEEIVKAAESANAHDFIMSFPDGYKTNVGAKGSKFYAEGHLSLSLFSEFITYNVFVCTHFLFRQIVRGSEAEGTWLT